MENYKKIKNKIKDHEKRIEELKHFLDPSISSFKSIAENDDNDENDNEFESSKQRHNDNELEEDVDVELEEEQTPLKLNRNII